MSSRRVLVVSGSAGHGHLMAGHAVAAALRTRHPELDVAHLDAVARMASAYARIYRWGYVRLVDRHPMLWRHLYESTNRRTSKLGHALTILGGRPFIDVCRRWKPDLIVCTHFLAPELLAREIRKGRLASELQVVVTDHDLHRVWYWPEISHYYVASELVKARLALRFGVPESNVTVTGIPVRDQFTQPCDAVSVRTTFGLDPARPTVAFMTGGFAYGPMTRAIVGLWMERRDAQIIAICGKNERLRRRVAALPRPTGAVLHALGFVENVAEVLSVADVVVSKSGGISVSECAALGKPLVISGAIAGQEERNAHAVVEAGAGRWAPTSEEVRWRVARLLNDDVARRAMAEAAFAFAEPDAAAAIADAAVGTLPSAWERRRPHFHGAV